MDELYKAFTTKNPLISNLNATEILIILHLEIIYPRRLLCYTSNFSYIVEIMRCHTQIPTILVDIFL